MASQYVVGHEVLHVVEEVSALEYLESLLDIPVSGRYGVMAAANDFFQSRTWHQDAVVQPSFTMMEGGVRGRLVRMPWCAHADG